MASLVPLGTSEMNASGLTLISFPWGCWVGGFLVRILIIVSPRLWDLELMS